MKPMSIVLAAGLLFASALPAAAQTETRGPAPADDAAILRAFEERLSKAIAKAQTVAVSIKVDRIKDTARPAPRMPGLMGGPGPFGQRPAAPVSGTILGADGWIATTYFNIEGELRGVEVTLPDGTVHPAEVKGWHRGADIALLKIEAKGLATLPPAPAADLRTGDLVVAVGRAPDGRGLTANQGILSAPGRRGGRGVQIDCRMNYGNVGGPLVDLQGRLVGMTCKITMVNAGDLGQNSGVGFAIISPKIDELLPDLKAGVQTAGGDGRPFLGVVGDLNYAGADGARLESIQSSGSADKAGLKPGDVVQSIDGVKITTFDDLRGEILKRKVGDQVKLKVKRGDEVLDFEMALGERPGE